MVVDEYRNSTLLTILAKAEGERANDFRKREERKGPRMDTYEYGIGFERRTA